MTKISFLLILILLDNSSQAQNEYLISGKLTESGTPKPIPDATIHLTGSNLSTLTRTDGTFRIYSDRLFDSLEITSIGYATIKMALDKNHLTSLNISMQHSAEELQALEISVSRKPGKSFMQRVIEQKNNNNPSRFNSYTYQRYTRNELDVDNIDYQKATGNGLESLMLKTYGSLDGNAVSDKELPIYFDETLANVYHSKSPHVNQENIIAKKNLGLKTDAVLGKLDKFYFHFNVYNDWLPIFDQTYVSPLNSNAFYYYNFFEADSTIEEGEPIQEIRFTPKRTYERAFGGFLWVNKNSLAVTAVIMHLNKTANINFIRDINYTENYKQAYDSATDKMVYMPYKYISEIKFESGLDLLGIPVAENKNNIKFIFRNTTVTDNLNLSVSSPSVIIKSLVRKEKTPDWYKSDEFWKQNRPEQLTSHESNIYKMVDSLKENQRFQRELKLLTFAGTGFWNFDDYLILGPYSSFLSINSIEGLRTRLGFWTMPSFSKKLRFFGYGAYGTKDQRLKGMLGASYVWDAAHWTKSTFTYGSDYDFLIDQDDELDKDNLINSLFKKKIPFTRTYVRKATLSHDQYLLPDWSAGGKLSYMELTPVFDFHYRPVNPALDKPYDNVFTSMLPVAEASFYIRYSHKEQATFTDYDKISKGSFYPSVTLGYSYGFEFSKAQFEFNRVRIAVDQKLRLPPKGLFYYKIETGKIFGTLPYLILNIPAGNEYYVASRYQFNTMSPYEFAADRYVNLHTRLTLGGLLLDKIPLIRKLGWRERFSFNAYWGDMTKANIEYNKGSNFNLVGNTPFMEASAGIENIFHLISIEYYRRFNHLSNPYARKGGVYIGVTFSL